MKILVVPRPAPYTILRARGKDQSAHANVTAVKVLLPEFVVVVAHPHLVRCRRSSFAEKLQSRPAFCRRVVGLLRKRCRLLLLLLCVSFEDGIHCGRRGKSSIIYPISSFFCDDDETERRDEDAPSRLLA